GSVLGDRSLEAVRDEIERLVPARPRAADLGMKQPPFEPERLAERCALRARPPGVRRMLGVPGDLDAHAFARRDEAAADAAVRARRANARAAHAERVFAPRSGTATRIRPFSILTSKRSVAPSSGPVASPLSRSMTQSCNGHVTQCPCTIPWDSGPPRCGQRSSSA